ncbi:hypothetical protein [Sulfuracidifex tepidarius]|uniref:Uncharacterized protein n=1 Tax=Sulfuracidifex tepidarius TaxID=1294262 RepID=A0A510DTT3_9CREN|nr:hypothetical protein [Sulfuracidifex tepidarius]BBG23643.1 hypothetical protein IC006_0931 [Sulfuracidifex tepidarius]BBG26390.1 hypothetical protein IC007_0898 [Sulfuracidifex tepidarius]
MRCNICGKESDGDTSVKIMKWIVSHYKKHGYPVDEIREKLDLGCDSLWDCREYEDDASRGKEYLVSTIMRIIIIEDEDGVSIILGKNDETLEPLSFKRKT